MDGKAIVGDQRIAARLPEQQVRVPPEIMNVAPPVEDVGYTVDPPYAQGADDRGPNPVVGRLLRRMIVHSERCDQAGHAVCCRAPGWSMSSCDRNAKRRTISP